MATILMTWELGMGLGHLLPLRAVGVELVARGHKVVLASREIASLQGIFGGTGISFIPAPVYTRQGKVPYAITHSYAHILANIGFADEAALASLVAAWETVFDLVQPQLVVADHSPTALLALRGRDVPRVTIGTGFCCPPDTFPLPFWWFEGTVPAKERIIEDEQKLLEGVNRVLCGCGKPKLERLGRLYALDDVVLGSYRELDTFGERKGGRYWGHWHVGSGVEPAWPAGDGPKVFAYLKSIPIVEEVLLSLRMLDVQTLVLSGGISEAVQQKYAAPNLRFAENPYDMAAVAARCDLAILNAGHGTTCSMLLAGKPCLLLPIFAEQQLTSQAVERMGAGRWLLLNARGKVGCTLREMLENESYRQGAQRFAARYAGFAPGEQVGAMVERMQQLLRLDC
jgi:UDP:flavonoid glycosyltransferase YjiC (YdhE family)